MTQMCIECLPHGIKQLEEFGISQHILIEFFCGYMRGIMCMIMFKKKLQFICESANTKESEVINGSKSHVYKTDDILSHEQTIAMIIELNHGIPGFDNDEIKDILYYISTI